MNLTSTTRSLSATPIDGRRAKSTRRSRERASVAVKRPSTTWVAGARQRARGAVHVRRFPCSSSRLQSPRRPNLSARKGREQGKTRRVFGGDSIIPPPFAPEATQPLAAPRCLGDPSVEAVDGEAKGSAKEREARPGVRLQLRS